MKNAVVVAGLCCALALGCGGEVVDIFVHVPVGFKGEVRIGERSEGAAATSNEVIRRSIQVGVDGVGKCRSLELFARWHRIVVCWPDGTQVVSGVSAQPGGLEVTEMGRENDELIIFIGTAQEYAQYIAKN